jgi:hypothetical protein
VDELGDGCHADRADVAGLVADRVQHLLVLVEDALIAPDPDGELAVSAPTGPPLTGASSICAPLAANAASSFFTTIGEFVERSKRAAPGLIPASRPSAAAATASTSAGSGNDVKITLACSATARGDSAHFAPVARCHAAAVLRLSLMMSLYPYRG